MKKYVYLLKKGLRWSIPSAFTMILINYFIIHKNNFSYLDIIMPLISFICIGGPLVSYMSSLIHKDSFNNV